MRSGKTVFNLRGAHKTLCHFWQTWIYGEGKDIFGMKEVQPKSCRYSPKKCDKQKFTSSELRHSHSINNKNNKTCQNFPPTFTSSVISFTRLEKICQQTNIKLSLFLSNFIAMLWYMLSIHCVNKTTTQDWAPPYNLLSNKKPAFLFGLHSTHQIISKVNPVDTGLKKLYVFTSNNQFNI